MERLNFKRAGAAFLILAIAAGCTTNPPVNKLQTPAVKTAALKAAEIKTINLGTKDGGNVRVNIKFANKQKFHLKAPPIAISSDFPINTNVVPVPGSTLVLKLYRVAVPGVAPDPMARFDAPMAVGLGDGNVWVYTKPDPQPLNAVNFTGLRDGYDYYISARIYSPNYDLSALGITLDFDPTWNNTTNSTMDLSGLALLPTDKVTVNGVESYITTPPQGPAYDGFWVLPPISATPLTGVPFTSFSRNIVGIGTVGGAGGMATDGFQYGGGTAPAYSGPGGTLEEYVRFIGTGLNIANDDDFSNAGANNSWDMEINLMRSLGADVDGNIQVNQGEVPPPEKINP